MGYGHLGLAGSEFRLLFLTLCQAKELPACYGKLRRSESGSLTTKARSAPRERDPIAHVSRPIGECGPELSQVRAACRGSFLPIEKRIPITGGDPNFVPGGDLFPTSGSLSASRPDVPTPCSPPPIAGQPSTFCLLVIFLPLVKKDPHHQQIHFASPAGPAGDLSPPSNLFPRPVPPLSPSPVRFGREGAGLRRAPFGSDFGELSRVEPQGRRQSSRVRADLVPSRCPRRRPVPMSESRPDSDGRTLSPGSSVSAGPTPSGLLNQGWRAIIHPTTPGETCRDRVSTSM